MLKKTASSPTSNLAVRVTVQCLNKNSGNIRVISLNTSVNASFVGPFGDLCQFPSIIGGATWSSTTNNGIPVVSWANTIQSTPAANSIVIQRDIYYTFQTTTFSQFYWNVESTFSF